MALEEICKNCKQNFEIEDEDLKFYEKVSPVFSGKKYLIPPPTHCPDCRQQRRIAQCNERNLYPGECHLCHGRTLAQYPPYTKQPYLCRECWHGDKWDPRNYGLKFDFSRSFFEQFYELLRSVPQQALFIDGICVNSEYIHYAGSSKNCYLIMHADFCEDCYYGYGFKKNKSCVDGFYNLHCELCYDSVDVYKCYDLKGSQDCIRSSSSAFLRDCVGCSNCFCSVGLRNKQYYFENKPLSKKEYEKKMSAIDLGSYREYQFWKARIKELERDHHFKALQIINAENSFGNYLKNCKNAKYCFDCEDVEDAKYCYQLVLGAKDVFDVNQYGTDLQQSYECAISGNNSYHLLFTLNGSMKCSDLLYCYYMESSKFCFGCTSMHNQSYCILNKQYTKEAYLDLVPRIIEHMKSTGEWGEYFPIAHSLYGYNKTTAQLYYPLTKEQALSKGYRWDDYEPPKPQDLRVILAKDLSDNIREISDDILDAVIECEATKKLFKIIPQELKFYRTERLPLPRRSPDQRHFDRFQKRNPRKFWQRTCFKCKKEMWTTYAPDRSEIVYCERCYLSIVY